MALMGEKLYLLEFDDGVRQLYHNKDKALHQMINSWFNSYARENLNMALDKMRKIREGTNEAYDARDIESTLQTIRDDLDTFFNDNYIKCFAWLSEAEVID